MKATIQQVRQTQPQWFSGQNKRFFNDVRYWTVKGKRTGKTYLARATYAWTDMFGHPKKLHYRLNEVDQDTLEISRLIDDVFDTIEQMKDWLKIN